MLKKWLGLALKLGVSGGLIWFLLRNVDTAAVWSQVRTMGWMAPLGAVLMIIGLQTVVGGLRWWIVQRAIHAPLPFSKTIELFLVGTFFNQVLPSAVGGDAVRIYKAFKSGLTFSQAFNGVMLERLATVFALILLVVGVQPLLLARIDAPVVVWIFPALALAGVAGIGLLMSLDRLPERYHSMRLVRGLAALARDSRRLFFSLQGGVGSLVVAALGHVNVSLAVWVLALGMGLPVGPLDCILLVPPVLLILTLPISIAGWGVREGAMVTAFGMIGVSAEGALALSLVFGGVGLVCALPGGIIWSLGRDRMADVPQDMPTENA
ncbi:lysylphosphatidylglycerol synthase transmembrane domain-containing protein [Magnetospira thiophila]